MILTRPSALALLAGLLSITGCDILGIGQACESYAAPGISITLADSTAGGPILGGEALILAKDGGYADSVEFDVKPANYNIGIGLAYERTGVYTVEAYVADYRPWVRSGVRVTKTRDGCHVETRALTAHLAPAG